MSLTLLEFARLYVSGRLKTEVFSEAYIELWKIERDGNVLQLDEPSLSECLSSIFCAADMYEPDESREEYEFDGETLRAEVASLLQKIVAD